ncbi:outer membrane beta-barrel protein [Desulfonatronum thiodismutans]|uniref:outer membrane beta-barrel protein n=1 Tax=Desulfonatronum thiodismutans TaxID=159290 RepID=UPI0004ABD675|nr:outer membrane beta-barrel protein [Desulfonatronum thiodismutans]
MQYHTLSHAGTTLMPILLLLFLALLMFPSPTTASEFTIRPSIAISEEYSDNVNQDREKLSEFTTRVKPGLFVGQEARYWDLSLSYDFEYLYYAQGNKKKGDGTFMQDDTKHTVNARGLARLVPNLLFLEIRNDYRRVDLNLLRSSQISLAPDTDPDGLPIQEYRVGTPETEFVESTERDRDSSDRNVFSISPFIEFQPTPLSTLRAGYKYTNTWYKEEDIEKKHLHEAFLDAGYELTGKLGLDAGYFSAWERVSDPSDSPDQDEEQLSGREDRHTVYAGPRYAYAENSSIYTRIGNTWRRSPDWPSDHEPYWSAGLTHAFAAMTAALMSQVRYTYDPLKEESRREILNTASLTRPYARGSMAVTGAYTLLNEPKGTKVATGVHVTHELTQRLTANARLNYSRRKEDKNARQEDGTQETFSERINDWRLRLGLTHLLARDFTLDLNYLFIDSASNDPLSDDTFRENRITLEVKKVF